MTIVSPLGLYGLFKAVGGLLFLLTVLWIVISYFVFQEFVMNQWLAAVLLLLAAVAGMLVYQRFSRLALHYDKFGFALFTGKNKVAAGQWKHFNQVSLYHTGYGMFAIRVYTPEKTFIDIPASELKLDPRAFRDFVTGLLKESQAAETKVTSSA